MRQIVREVSKNAFSEVLQAAEGAAEDGDVVPDAERVEAERLQALGADAAVDVVIDSIGGDQGIGAEYVARIGELCIAILIRLYAFFVHDRLGEIVENRLQIQQNVQSIQCNRFLTATIQTSDSSAATSRTRSPPESSCGSTRAPSSWSPRSSATIAAHPSAAATPQSPSHPSRSASSPPPSAT